MTSPDRNLHTFCLLSASLAAEEARLENLQREVANLRTKLDELQPARPLQLSWRYVFDPRGERHSLDSACTAARRIGYHFVMFNEALHHADTGNVVVGVEVV